MTKPLSIQEILSQACMALDKVSDSPRIDAEVLLCHVLSKNRSYLYTYPERELAADALMTFKQLIEKRQLGHPIAYLLMNKEFWSMKLALSPATLIPRPATERLVELALSLMPAKQKLHILDLGTGSGAIALALAKERPHWQVDACDLSEAALNIAKHNAKQLNLEHIQFYQSNWFGSLPAQTYDLIVSNPPYIAQDDPHLNQGDLRFEPQHALISGLDGLNDIRHIIQKSPSYLSPGAFLLIEHGYNQKPALKQLLHETGFQNIECWQDYEGIDRISGGNYACL